MSAQRLRETTRVCSIYWRVVILTGQHSDTDLAIPALFIFLIGKQATVVSYFDKMVTWHFSSLTISEWSLWANFVCAPFYPVGANGSTRVVHPFNVLGMYSRIKGRMNSNAVICPHEALLDEVDS
jgi:hypothetical protein